MAPKRRRNSSSKGDESSSAVSSETKLSNSRKNGNGPARRGRPAKAAPINPNLPSRYLVRSVYIGVGNARRWSEVKRKLGYAGDVDFVAFLLAMAEDHARGQPPNLTLATKLGVDKQNDGSLVDEDDDAGSDSHFLDEPDFPRLTPEVQTSRKEVCNKRDSNTTSDPYAEDQYKAQRSKLSVTVASRKDYSGAIEVSNGLDSESIYDFTSEGSGKSRTLRGDNDLEDDDDEEEDDENCEELGVKKEECSPNGSVFDPGNDPNNACYAMPSCLLLEERDSSWGLTAVTAEFICKFFELGFLKGEIIQITDLEESFPMRHLWETMEGSVAHYISTIDPQKSNWWRHLRPAYQPSDANVSFARKDGQVQLYSTTDIEKGQELRYWVENESYSNKTEPESTKCLPCDLELENLQFYYKHCAIFHDPARSLALKKYSCKVCGEELIGKEALVQHAAQFHEGKGAYQCNFCHKFFLRVNYLEMHRTYGCSANPQRCRPKCDICGRNFCQPQKLKTHIQRVHGEQTDEASNKKTTCKLCDKSFDTRPALQRHLKDVHKKDMSGTCACDQCGKLFQNKSNLKIHMLTHSGVKPFKKSHFRCPEEDCGLGFSTKQCLQVHLKKGHGFTEDNMPKVERSVPYTFDAYSGGAVRDPGRGKTPQFVSGEQPTRKRNTGNCQNGEDSPANSGEQPKGAKRRGRQPGWRKNVLVAEDDMASKETENSNDKDLPVSDISGRHLSDDSSSVSSPTTTSQSSPAATNYTSELVPPPQPSYEMEEVGLASKTEASQREAHALDYSSRMWSTSSNELSMEHNPVHNSTLEDLNENNTSWRNLTLSPPPSSDDQGLDMSLTSNPPTTNRQQPATPIAVHEELRSPPLAYPERPASCYANDIITSFSRPLSRPIPSRPLSRSAYGVAEPLYPPSNFAPEPTHEFDERELQLPPASPAYPRQPDTSRSSPFQTYPQPAYSFSQPQPSHPSPSPSPGLQNTFHASPNAKPFPNYPPRPKPTTMMPPNPTYGTEISRSMTPMPDYSRFTNTQQVHRGLPSPGAGGSTTTNNNPYPSPAASPGFHPPPSPRVLPSGYQNFQNLGYQNYPLAPPPYNRPAGQVYNPYGNYY